MKKELKKSLKIGILCLAMALIQISCEKNDNSIDNELQQEKKVSRVSFSDFNINVAHNRQYQDLEKYFDISKSSNQNLQNRIDANDDITVLTDVILVIQKNDISYYTFKIVAPSENNEFYNLIVHVNNLQQIIKSELYEYIPNSEWLQDINQPYTGQIKVLDNNFISLEDLFSARGSGRCLTGASGEWECSFGNNHAPGTCNGSSFEYIITLEYGPCPNEPIEYIIAETPDEGDSGEGSGGSILNQNPTPTIPTTPCEQNDGIATQTIGITDGSGDCLDMDAVNNIQTIENCINNSTIDLYSLSSTNLSAISNFINTIGCSEQIQTSVSQALTALLDNPNIPYNLIEDWFLNTPDYTEINLNINPDNITYETPLSQQELPSFDDFVNNFPKLGTTGNYSQMPTSQVYQLVGGSLWTSHQNQPESYSNACSIRGSRGLLYSGIDIPVLNYPGLGQRTQKGGDNENYILDAVSFDKYMRDKFGSATYELTGTDANDPVQVANLLSGKNGIYVIINSSHNQAGYSGHVDAIIDGDCISSAYTTPSGGVESIRIWELN